VAVVKPFRAVRYDPERAGPLETLVAPPYDVLGPEARARYLAASPYNVVHLTLADEEAAAGRLWADWQREGVLARDEEPALWWLAQDYVGPDGVARTREGLVAAVHVEPYERGVIRPHERTHAGPKEGRLRLLRAVRAQLEPILLLYDGDLAVAVDGPPLLEVAHGGVTNRLWRLDAEVPAQLGDASLLIADGHHRYETTLAFDPGGSVLAAIVPTEQEGLTIFPTHRIVQRLADTDGAVELELEDALGRLRSRPQARAAAVLYRDGRAALLEGDEGELDAAFVERFGPQGVTYTPDADEAVEAVDAGRAEAAFLLRPPTFEQVSAVAARGDVMPQKSTYFYPKLLSGLLFLPV
jgi:uncharacterized protein (DUF1015 family)